MGEQEKATRAKGAAFENKGLKKQVEKEGVQAVLRKQALVGEVEVHRHCFAFPGPELSWAESQTLGFHNLDLSNVCRVYPGCSEYLEWLNPERMQVATGLEPGIF